MSFKSRRGRNMPPSSPSNSLAAVFANATQTVVISAFSADLDASTDPRDLIHARRFALTNEGVVADPQAIIHWLSDLGVSLPPSQFLTTPDGFTERTRAFPVEPEEQGLEPDGLAAAVCAASDAKAFDRKGQMIFEQPVDEMACDFAALLDGDLALTDVSRPSLMGAVQRLQSCVIYPLSGHTESDTSGAALRVETRLRAALRYWRLIEDSGEHRSGDSLTAFFIITEEGTVDGFWTSSLGLFKEYGEEFYFDDAPVGIPQFADHSDLTSVLDDRDSFMDVPEADPANLHRAALTQAIQFAVSKLEKKIAPGKLQEYGAQSVDEIIFVASTPSVAAIAAEQLALLEESGLRVTQLRVPLEEAVAQGLLLGSVDAEAVPPINLTTSLRARARAYEENINSISTAVLSQSRTRVAIYALAPFVVALAFLLISWLDVTRNANAIAERRKVVNQEAARLKPIAQAREKFVNTFNWMQSYVQQIIDLRKRQGTAISLYADLDARWPLADDSTFFSSQLKLSSSGALELTGYTKRKDALTALVNSMENAASIYAGVNYDIQEGTPALTAAQPPPGINLPVAGNTLPAGVIKWTIKALYKPLAPASPQGGNPAQAPQGTVAPASTVPAGAPAPPANLPNVPQAPPVKLPENGGTK